MKPTIPEVLPLVRAYYAKPGNRNGGSLHIVLEDQNVRDKDVRYCIDEARRTGDVDGVKIGELLLQMSKAQRVRIGMKI